MYIINKILLPYVLSNKLYFIVYTILSFIVYSIGSIVIPRTITEFINGNSKESTGFIKNIKSGSMKGILYVLGFFFTLYTLLQYLKDQLENDILMIVSTYSKKEIIKKIFYKYTSDYKEIPESHVSWIIQHTFGTIRHIVRYIFVFMIPCFIMFLLISIYFFYCDKRIGMLFVLQFLSLLLLLYIFNDTLITKYSKNDKVNIENNNFIGDKIKNLTNILFDNSIESELAHMTKKEDYLLYIMNDSYHIHNKIIFISNVISYFVFFLMLYILINKDKKIISTILIIFLIYKGIQEKFINDTLFQYFTFSKILKIDDFIKDINEIDNCMPIQQFKGIKLENVSYRYDEKSDYILRNVNILFKSDKINVLMGKSGSGKTTIMKLIIKMYNPTKGSIFLDETNSKDICQTDIRNNIYYVNQRTILFDESVLYNLQYGNHLSKENITQILQKYNLLDYYKTLEHGIETKCGVNGSNLSLGMQKIIMVMRGILKPNKQIVIFDEPLTSLDNDTRKKIVKLIVEETKSKTCIVITHDPEILPYADHIVRL